ncbi:MAG: adenosylcobinamide-phosphate synthase CbiB [Actinomycetota bacterium]|nr:adenosylcobinamide-phosphate synthase CbiB [Actinomycetota bacterium]
MKGSRTSAERLAIFGGALLLDRLLGEPPEGMHPVVWMGRALAFMTDHAPTASKKARLAYGAAGVSLLAVGSAVGADLALRFAARVGGRWPRLLVESWLLKTCLSHRGLEEAGRAVAEPLEAGDPEAARESLRSLVSRDRTSLDASLIAAAAVESLAENLSDSFTAPVLSYAAFGLPGAFFYRTVNTADAMVGYRTERFEMLGKSAARLDDALNFIPARLTACALVAASGGRVPGALAAMRRDRDATASPNAGWPMAAVAGSVGVVLEKPGHYVLNPAGRAPDAADIRRTISLCRRAAVLCGGIAAAFIMSGKSA